MKLRLIDFCLIFAIFFTYDSYAAGNIVDNSMISIVSSSSTHMLTSMISEEFGKRGKFRTPIVESAGNAIGFKDFCNNRNNRAIDVIASSRKINSNEIELCRSSGYYELKEILVGYDTLIFANSKNAEKMSLSSQELFKAIAENVPISENKQIWVKNNYTHWNEINKSLPNKEIEVFAPSFNSPANETILETILLKNCLSSFHNSKELYDERVKRCKKMRGDRHYRVSDYDSKITVKKLLMNSDAIGLISYSAYLKNRHTIQPILIDGVLPSDSTIKSGKYTLMRPIYFYIKSANISNVRGLEDFVDFLTNDRIVGESGILSQKGLIYGQGKVSDIQIGLQ